MMRESDSLYVYALAAPGLPPRFTLLGHRLQTFAADGVDVIVERAAAPELTTDAIRHQHEVVTRLAQRASVILPARFGSSSSTMALREIVSQKRSEILDGFALVRGCVQMTIRIFGSGFLAPVEARTAPRTGTEFMERLRNRAHAVPPPVKIVRRMMSSYVKAERIADGGQERRITVFHLVARAAVGSYREGASELQGQLEPLIVTITGPWPVFAFVPELF